MDKGTIKDFFISYNKADRLWAEWIAWQLEEEGYTTILQAWDFRPGSNFILEMQRAATEAKRIIAVLSPDYLSSRYTQPEWAVALAIDPTGEKGTLLPVRVRECDLHGLLPQIIYIDLLGIEESVAKNVLLTQVRRERAKPKKQPAFPVTATRSVTEQPQFPTLPGAGEAERQESPEKTHTDDKVSARPALPGDPSLGPLVFKLCNRGQQVSAFADNFISNMKRGVGVPQFYFIHGEEKECHDSLIERLAHTEIKRVAEKQWGEQRAVVALKKPVWPHEGEGAERQRELQRLLFSEFDPAYMEDDLSARALHKLTAHLLTPLIIIRHNIHVSNWNVPTRELLVWYINYWAEIKSQRCEPQFIIFFSIIYPNTQGRSWWKALSPFGRFDKGNIQRELQEICTHHNAGCPCTMLKELSPPRQYDVGDWFKRHNIYDLKTQGEFLDKLFNTNQGNISMAEIEHELRKIHQSFVKERGYA
ncbi:MAG TPA: TIR domain-containing protein [Pyrinomonadaceae bacterium]|nr:TIR domain-containing protein [Pyrinomonadaceae bacterium]